jgi:hypothetical protein
MPEEWINAVLALISIPLVIYFVKLEFRIRELEKHPFLDGIKDVNKEDAIKVYKKVRSMSDLNGGGSKNDSINPNEKESRDNLIEKFRTNPITISEAKELKRILEKEKQQAIEVGDIALLFGIGLLLGVVIEYLSNSEGFWKKIFKKRI